MIDKFRPSNGAEGHSGNIIKDGQNTDTDARLPVRPTMKTQGFPAFWPASPFLSISLNRLTDAKTDKSRTRRAYFFSPLTPGSSVLLSVLVSVVVCVNSVGDRSLFDTFVEL